MTTIPIQVDDATARAFESAPQATREQIALLVRGYVSETILSKQERSKRFCAVADALGAEAASNGWSDDLNDALLRGEFDDE